MATGIAVHVAFLLFGLGAIQRGQVSLQLGAFVGPIVFFSLLSGWFRRRVTGSMGDGPRARSRRPGVEVAGLEPVPEDRSEGRK